MLNELEVPNLLRVLNQAIELDPELKKRVIKMEESEALLYHSGGDARKLLNILEILVDQVDGEVVINNNQVNHFLQERIAHHDKSGEAHYDIISAFIKSIRGIGWREC